MQRTLVYISIHACFLMGLFLSYTAFAEPHQSSRNGVYGFLTPQQVTVSADGKHIYIINRSKSGEKPVLFRVP
jgi:hypothetical protein